MRKYSPLLMLLLVFVACSSSPEVAPNSNDDATVTTDTPATTPSTATPTPTPEPTPSTAKTSVLDDHFFIGSVSEDSTSDLNFWNNYAADPNTARQIPARYIYINGGFSGGWRTWGSVDGDRAINYIRNSFVMGMTPFFVFYQIPGSGGESASIDLANIQSATYMRDYFLDLQFLLDIIKREGGDKEVGIILEPDFLGYMMQQVNLNPDNISAQVTPAYTAGVLTNADTQFPNTLTGLVQAINYIIAQRAPNANFGWEMNLWASPGIHHSIPSSGLCRITDTLGIPNGRQAIRDEAAEVATFYKNAGVLSQKAKWVFIDKYGLDATGADCADPNQNPAACIWFWNSDHWGNYATYIEELHRGLATPVVLWQIPVGHLNNSPGFSPLLDQSRSHEDSAPDFVFGDTFQPTTVKRFNYFGDTSDVKTTKSGNNIIMQSHINELVQAGVVGVLFGAGTGDSTDFDSDSNWWITKVQEYYQSPKTFP